MRTMKNVYFLTLCIFFLLVSCSRPNGQTIQAISPTSIATIRSYSTEIFQPTPPPTATEPRLIPSPTIKLSPTPPVELTSTEATKINVSTISRKTIPVCPGNGLPATPSATFGIHGTILYQKGDRMGLYTVGGNPLLQSQIPLEQTDKYQVFGFSPDGKWLAYRPLIIPVNNADFNFDILRITLLSDTKEQVESVLDTREFVKEIPQEATFDGIENDYWINDQFIYVALQAKSPILTPTGYYIPLPKVFDPFTGQWDTGLMESLPDKSITMAGFSPNLQQALYAVLPDRLVFWEKEQGIVWEYSDLPVSSHTISQWAPDGSMIVAGNIYSSDAHERSVLLVVPNEKRIRIIADTNFPSEDHDLFLVSWSPDSRYLAMTWAQESPQLYIYDAIMNSYIYRCPLSGYSLTPYSLIWSPDSRFIAFGATGAPLQVMNIETGEIVELLQDATPMGWSATFPVEWP